MPRSKRIEDYFEIELDRLRPDEELPVALHLYFPASQHIITWREPFETITSEFLEKNRSKGVLKLWIHKEDQEGFERYLKNEPADTFGSAAKVGRKLAETLFDPILPEDRKKEETQNIAQQLLKEAGRPSSVDAQKRVNDQIREAVAEVIRDVFDETRAAAKQQFDEIWELANIDPEFEHGLNVSTFAVIFAMAFGRIERGLLADLAYAGLIHDIGLCQVPAEVTDKAWKVFSPEDLESYSGHVDAGIAIVNYFASPSESEQQSSSRLIVPERVKSIMGQHHEKFDGTGYPRAYKGFQVDDISQLLAIADILDSFASGQWDGEKRTLAKTFDLLEGLEKARTFPEYFNPDVFAAVVQWIRSAGANAAKANAVEIAQDQAKKLVGAG